MPKDVKTTVSIESQAKGFDKTTSATKKLGLSLERVGYSVEKGEKKSSAVLRRLDKTFKETSADMRKHIESVTDKFEELDTINPKEAKNKIIELKDYVSDLEKEQIAIVQTMSQIGDKGSTVYKGLKEHLRGVNETIHATNSEMKLLQDRFEEVQKEEKKGGIKGLVGGALVGGAAMYGYSKGRTMGGAVFGGVGGLQQAAGAIPIVGQVLAGQVGSLIQYAQQNIQFQKAQLEAAPYLTDIAGTELLQERQRTYNAIVKRERDLNKSKKDLADKSASDLEDISKREIKATTETINTREANATAIKEEDPWYTRLGKFLGKLQQASDVGQAGLVKEITRPEKLDKKLVAEARKSFALEREAINTEATKQLESLSLRGSKLATAKQGARATLAETPTGIEGLYSAGVRYMGLNKEEITRVFTQLLQVGGGYGTEAQEQGLRNRAFAAQTAFGIDMQTSGAFLRGGRRGGLVGGRGAAGKEFENAISTGLLMGLQGSELTQYMQDIAQGIMQFQQTGIEINYRSIASLATDIAQAGITGTRSLEMAKSMTQYTQGIGSKGITGAMDIFLLRELGGYRGGGTEEFRKARSKLERLEFGVAGGGVEDVTTSSSMMDTLRTFMSKVGGGQAVQTEMLQMVMQQMGVKGSVREFDWLANQLRGIQTPEMETTLAQEQKYQVSGLKSATALADKGLLSLAETTVSARAPSVKAMAAMQNKQIDTGGKFVGKMISLENAATNLTKAFETLAGPVMKKWVDVVEDVVDKLESNMDRLGDLMTF